MSEIAQAPKAPLRRTFAATFEAIRSLIPGLAVATLVAMSAKLVIEHHGGPVMFVALLGAKITVQYLADLGWAALIFVIAGVLLTIAAGVALSRLLGRSSWFGVLAGGAVGICGASAAAGLAAVLPRHAKSDADTAMTIIGVTALSTAAMIAYPIIGHVVGLDDRGAGFFLGVTIHDVAQVVGAGYSVSDQTGNIAVVVKLFRVLLLLPVVLGVALAVSVAAGRGGSGRQRVPMFVVGFTALVALSSLGLIPAEAAAHLSTASRWCLVIAMASIGINTSLGEIRELGYRPAAILVGATVFIAVLGLAGALLLFTPLK